MLYVLTPPYPGGIFWLRALGNDASRPAPSAEEQSALRADQLRSFAVALGIAVRDLSAEEIQARLAIKLGNENRSFLWIVDDLASALEADTIRGGCHRILWAKGFLPPGAVRYQEFGHSVNLGGLAPEEAVELLAVIASPVTQQIKARLKVSLRFGLSPVGVGGGQPSLGSRKSALEFP